MSPAVRSLLIGLVAGLVPSTLATAFLSEPEAAVEGEMVEHADSAAGHGAGEVHPVDDAPAAEAAETSPEAAGAVEAGDEAPVATADASAAAASTDAADQGGADPAAGPVEAAEVGASDAPVAQVPGASGGSPGVAEDGGTALASPAADPAAGEMDTFFEEPAARVARILGSMRARSVAAVLEDLEDARIQEILDHMGDRKVAEIMGRLSPERAAALVRGRLEQSGEPGRSGGNR